jgi:hypothetical protein
VLAGFERPMSAFPPGHSGKERSRNR